MISFVWSSKYPFISGAGGSENYTAGQIRELQRRGIECRVLIIGHSAQISRRNFPDIKFKTLKDKEELSDLDDTIIFITYPLDVRTKNKSYVILHCPPPAFGNYDPIYDPKGMTGKRLIATSGFAARMWSRYYAMTSRKIPAISIVYPFAEPSFSKVERKASKNDPIRMLFAGRLISDKGIYTLLTALHLYPLRNLDYKLTVTTAGQHSEDGQIIKKLLEVHPYINLVPSRNSPKKMAELMAQNDLVIMPTTNIFWRESFGIVSVEAQHAGCRVVASKSGGLPETDCGGALFVKPDNPLALAKGIVKAASLGALSDEERKLASAQFTISKSVDALLKVIRYDQTLLKTARPRKAEARMQRLYSSLSLNSGRSKQ